MIMVVLAVGDPSWLSTGGVGALLAIAALLVWRLVRLGSNQEEQLLAPAYKRIVACESRIGALEKEKARCEERLAHALFTLRVNGFDEEETP